MTVYERLVINMNVKRQIAKALPQGWELRKNFYVQDGSKFGYRCTDLSEYKWTILNEYRQVVYVGKTLDRIYEELEGVKEEIEKDVDSDFDADIDFDVDSVFFKD